LAATIFDKILKRHTPSFIEFGCVRQIRTAPAKTEGLAASTASWTTPIFDSIQALTFSETIRIILGATTGRAR